MRLHRFYIKHEIDKGTINSLSNASLVHQLRRVFRLHEGDRAVFFDGSGFDHESEIVSMSDEELSFRVLETRAVKLDAPRKVSLAFSLIKKDNSEWIVQKGTELGISEFIPVVSERSEKKGFNMERAEKIVIEACEQSGRADIPLLREPIELEAFLRAEGRSVVAFHIEGEVFDRKGFLEGGDMVALVGPEGGWSDEEIELFKESGVKIVRLNSPVLRAETAAVAIATLLLI